MMSRTAAKYRAHVLPGKLPALPIVTTATLGGTYWPSTIASNSPSTTNTATAPMSLSALKSAPSLLPFNAWYLSSFRP